MIGESESDETEEEIDSRADETDGRETSPVRHVSVKRLR